MASTAQVSLELLSCDPVLHKKVATSHMGWRAQETCLVHAEMRKGEIRIGF